jgi:hypothetical protein
MAADPQAREVVVVHDDDVFALIVAHHVHFRCDVCVGIGRETATGLGVERGDQARLVFDFLDRHFELAGEFGVFVRGDQVEVVQREFSAQGVAVTETAELQPQTLAEAAGRRCRSGRNPE